MVAIMPHAAESFSKRTRRAKPDVPSSASIAPNRSAKCPRPIFAPQAQTLSTLLGQDHAGEADLAVHEGDVLAGQYLVLALIGLGGMGVVVSARHLQLGVPVAIKLLLPHLCGEKDAITQFAREVCAAVEIENEHVARVFDVGVLESGTPYMVMELLDGEDLEAWLHHHGPLPVEQAVDFVLQACEAIAEAHALGIVHRDVKPSNLFITRQADGTLTVKLLDFGVSIATGAPASGTRRTLASSVAGSPLYMSPEQMDSPDEVDGRADIWALGVCLYELISGRKPFSGTTLPAIRCTIGTKTPAPIRESRPDVPPGIERIVCRCLGKRRNYRYRDVAELALALRDYAPERSWPSVERIRRSIEGGTRPSPALNDASPVGPSSSCADEPPTAMASHSLCRSRSSIIEAAEGLVARCGKSTLVGSALASL
jgi:serine/threonine-protein kinase